MHLDHFAQGGVEGRRQLYQPPGKRLHCRSAAIAGDHPLDRLTHFAAFRVPVALHMKASKRLKLMPAGQQRGDGVGDVGQISPLMPDADRPRAANDAGKLTRLDQPLRKPVISGAWTKKIARPNNQRPATALHVILQRQLHLHPDGTFAGHWLLCGLFSNQRKGIRSIVIDRAGQDN